MGGDAGPRVHKSEVGVIYSYAMSLVGLPYIWGGQNPLVGFDCSGLVIELLSAMGKFPHGADTTAHGLYRRFADNPVSTPRFGCLSFYGWASDISHVGFCLGEELMIEAGGGNPKCTSRRKAAKYGAFVRIRPIDYRGDLVAIRKP